MSSKKYLRSVLSTIIAMVMALSGVAISVAMSARFGWFNDKVLKNELTSTSYVNQSIDEMTTKIYALVQASISDTTGLDKILDKDNLYKTFHNAETALLTGNEANMNDVEAFRSELASYFDEKLEGVYRSEQLEAQLNSTIEEAVHVYKNYMHPQFFKGFYENKQKIENSVIVVLIIGVILIAGGILTLPLMYHYRRHAYPYAVGGLTAAIICNIMYIFGSLRNGWVSSLGIEPACYRAVVSSMTKYGGYVGLMVTALELILLCFLGYFIKKSKKH